VATAPRLATSRPSNFEGEVIRMGLFQSSDPWAIVTIVLTCGLFAASLFLTGFTHDLLLEAGVFLVSVKLILMAKKNGEAELRLEQRLARIEELLKGRQTPSA
jgi:hypothetical protein